MADDAATTTEDTQITFNVKAANDQKHVLTLPNTTTIADLKAKLSTSEYADVPAERQRLIYSGRVLKDPDTLASVKIKDGHTVHLVKGAASNARQNPANQGTSSTASGGNTQTPQVPTNIAAGTGNNPLAGLTGARYAGFHGLPGMDTFGPDGGMGGPATNPEAILEQMENPMFLSQMNEAMNNPAVVEMMLQSPMIRDNPMLQQVLRNPEMRRMMFSPEMMRMQLQMQRNMGNSGPSFPAPGATDNTTQPGSTATGAGTTATPNQPNTTGPANPFAAFGGAGAGAGANPFASLFTGNQNPAAPQQQGATQNTQDASGTFPNLFGGAGAQGGQANPFAAAAQRMMQDPEAMRNMMQMMGGAGGAGADPFAAFGQGAAGAPGGGAGQQAGANPFAALFGPGGFGGAGGFGAPAPADNRPPEEIYETQLRQLNEMGFYEFDRNVAALRRSGGNVQGAIEHLLNGGA